ncbi:MAG: hypothetical protein ACYC7L_02610 [Nitrospirota bacterium]
MRTYDLYIQRTLKILTVVVLVILVLVALMLFSGILKDRRGEGPPWFMGVFFLAVAGFNAYYWVLRVPHRISAADDGHVEFVSLVRTKRFAARDIRSIMPDAGQIGFLVIKTDQDKVRILNQFDRFHDFLVWLKTQNPAVELRGC